MRQSQSASTARKRKPMTKREQQWYHSLLGIRNEFQTVVNDIKRNDMVVCTEVLNLIDSINKLSVEV